MAFRSTVLALFFLVLFLQLRDEVHSARDAWVMDRLVRSSLTIESELARLRLEACRDRAATDYETRVVHIDRGELARMLEAPTLPGAARLVPSRDRHGERCLAVYAVRPGSLLEALGFQNGDYLLTINGADVLDTPAMTTLRASLPAPDFLDLELERRGKRVRIVVLVNG